ncbi:MAG: amidohydrolase family protein [Proteobacteria bacterium]|nr:amidohydrolase family protein [Pseudomonadota bacterium]
MNIYGPSNRFPPETTNGLCNRTHWHHYLALRKELSLSRTVYVQPSHYERDNSCMLDAMASDPAEARGVAVVGVEAATSEFKRLNDIGVRGARFSFLFSGCLTYEELDPVANRIAAFNWHAQLQLDGNELPLLERQLKALPVPIVIDHLGRIPVTGRTQTISQIPRTINGFCNYFVNGVQAIKSSTRY